MASTRTDPRLLAPVTAGGTAFGAFCAIPSALVAEALGTAGLDWVCLDRQHGFVSDEACAAMIAAADLAGVPALVRVTENATHAISWVLDAGAVGVIVPMIQTVDEARRAVDAACYPPLGGRSWGPIRSAFRPSPSPMPFDGHVLVMLETAPAVERADEILSVPGVAGAFVGPSDLAVSLGLSPREVTRPEVTERCRAVAATCARLGLVAGIGAHGPGGAGAWIEMGFRLISLGRDLNFLREAAIERLADARGGDSGGASRGHR